jgi:hypothetical protein
LVIAMTIPISTNTTIASCNQIHVGDMTSGQPTEHDRHLGPASAARAPTMIV